MPFSIVAIPFWILTNSVQGFQFPHILAKACYIPGIFLVHPTCTWWDGWGLFSLTFPLGPRPTKPQSSGASPVVWAISFFSVVTHAPSVLIVLASMERNEQSYPVHTRKGAGWVYLVDSIHGDHKFSSTTTPQVEFSLHSHCFADEKLEAHKK